MNPAPINSPVSTDSGAVNPAWVEWFQQAFVVLFSLRQSGPTAKRPTKNLWIGRRYFDTDLGKPVWVSAYSGSATWVDATGATV